VIRYGIHADASIAECGDFVKSKHYNPRQLETLVSRLIDLVEPRDEGRHRRRAGGRALVRELLEARFGDVAIGASEVNNLDTLSDEEVTRQLQRMRGLLLTMAGVQVPMWIWASQSLTLLAFPKGEFSIEIQGPLNELISVQLVRVVRAVGRHRLCVCDCRRLFLRVGKRKSCSIRCQKRVYMRRYRGGEAGEGA
jgi:hypothetical protein